MVSQLYKYMSLVHIYCWHTNLSIEAIVSLLAIALTPRAEKPMMISSSASMKMFQQDAFYYPDTYVSFLSVRRYPHLCKNTSFVTGTGQNHRDIENETIFHALGLAKAAALPAFHALNGDENTGCFSGKGKGIPLENFYRS